MVLYHITYIKSIGLYFIAYKDLDLYLVCSGDVQESSKMTRSDVGRLFYDVQVFRADILTVCPSDSIFRY